MDFLITLLAFLVAIGVLITVHEFGHFWVARRLGVKILRFSIGFGQPLWRRVGRDGTEYVIAALPLGGYVKMLDEREDKVPENQLDMAFNRQSLKVRSAIVAAGPVFNLVFAILAYWLVFMAGESAPRPIIGEVTPESPAEQAGFMAGDEILAVGEHTTLTWEDVVYALLTETTSSQAELAVKVRDQTNNERFCWLSNTQLSEYLDQGNLFSELGLEPWRPELPAVIGTVLPNEAAALAGLQPNDKILSVNGEVLSSWNQWVELIRQQPNTLMQLEVERAGQGLTIPLTTGVREEDGQQIGRIGASVAVPDDLYDDYHVHVRWGPIDAFGRAVGKTWELSALTVKMIGRMLIGQTSIKHLGGPITIAETAGKSARYGLNSFLKFLAIISISLGVLNLLPIPMLDGGHLFFFLIEAVKGSPLPEAVLERGQQVGLALLLALMGLAFYLDLSRLLGSS